MKICIIGTGYVGLVSATCLAEIGHQTIGVDCNQDKIKLLKKGQSPIYERDLEKLIQKNQKAKRLQFTTSLEEGLENAEIVINAVGTPSASDGSVNLNFVYQVARQTGQIIDHDFLFVDKSTVPVGTGQKVREIISQELTKRHLDSQVYFSVVSNPEFLREGSAINDFLQPDRIVIGTDNKKDAEKMAQLYSPLTTKGIPLVQTNIKSAEMIKYTANSFLATKISFINEISQLCELVGADVLDVAKGIGLDSRIGLKFLQPGPGFGGSCFPKDIAGLYHTAKEKGLHLKMIEATQSVNEQQQLVALNKLQKHFSSLQGKNIAIWGLAFKPNTDDIRQSSSIKLIQELLKMNTIIYAHDPIALTNTRQQIQNPHLFLTESAIDSLPKADALILMTHWDDYRKIPPQEIVEKMKGNLIIDTRNFWDKKDFAETKIIYLPLGRQTL